MEERLLIAFAKRASGRTVALVAVLLYAGIGLAVPLVLALPTSWLVSLNIMGTTLAGLLILVWLGVRVPARDRRHLVEWTTDLRLLDAAEFEWLVGEVFRRDGWKVEETGRQDGPDGNVDLRLTRGGKCVIVQCKTLGVVPDRRRCDPGLRRHADARGSTGIQRDLRQPSE